MSAASVTSSSQQTIQQLRQNLNRLQRGLRVRSGTSQAVSTGVAALDRLLPEQGLLRGTLSEWIAAERGSGALTLALKVAAQAAQTVRSEAASDQSHQSPESQRSGWRPVIVVDADQAFYPPALPATGLPPEQTVVVRPASRTDVLWVLEQSLRCPGVAAVIGCLDYLKTQEFRRLQLAAEAGTAVGLLLRSLTARRQPGWADVRLLISPCSRPVTAGSPIAGSPGLSGTGPGRQFSRRLRVQCVYAKGGFTDQTIELDLCDETGAVCLAAELSHPAAAVRTIGA